MKRSHRPSSIGSTAGNFTRCCTPSNKASSVPSPAGGETKDTAQQMTVYLNSLELQAALTKQQTSFVRSESTQLQAKSHDLVARVETLRRQRQLSEALIVTQETEIARVKLAAMQVSGQNLPKRFDDIHRIYDEQLSEFHMLVTSRRQTLPPSPPAPDSSLDRVSELILGQIRMYSSRLDQQEQEIRAMSSRFMQELSFLNDEKDLLRNQIKDQMETRLGEVRNMMRLSRKQWGRRADSRKGEGKKRVRRQERMSM